MRTNYPGNVWAALFVALIITLACASLVAPAISRADEPYAVIIERGIAVKMRDGVTLRADVYRPKADGKFPVILTRTPYDKTGNLGTCMRVAAAGYVCVAQDVRGRFTSEGEWYPFKHESEDGYDTIEWLAHQPWSTGVVGMWGGAYVGAAQMLAAVAKPAHPARIFSDRHCFGLSRELDVSGWRVRAMVQRVVVDCTCRRHDAQEPGRISEAAGVGKYAAARKLSCF